MNSTNPTRPKARIGWSCTVNSLKRQGSILQLNLNKPLGFSFIAGQYVTLRLTTLKHLGESESARTMSIASAPEENDLIIVMQTSQSQFKQAVGKIKPGDSVELDGPFGYFSMHNTADPALFVAGGIGIAPFRPLLLQENSAHWPHAVTLFYSISSPDNAAFLEELSALQNPAFRLVVTCTQSYNDTLKGCTIEKGRINESMIRKYIPELKSYHGYIVGSPIMVTDMHNILCDLNIDPRQITTEPFTGYST